MRKNTNHLISLSVLMLCGLMGTYTVPLLIGIFVDVFGLSESSASTLGAVEILAIALSAMVVSAHIGRWNAQKTALVATAVLMGTQLLTAFVDRYLYLAVIRGVAGISSGLLLALVNSHIARTENPERLYGSTLALVSLGFALLLFALPYLYGIYGLKGLFGTLAMISLLALSLSHALPQAMGASLTPSGTSVSAIDYQRVLLFFAIISAMYTVMGGTWAFAERVASNIGIDRKTVGLLLGLSTVAGIFGAATAARLSEKRNRRWPTVVGFLVSGISCLLMTGINNIYIFSLGTLIYGFVYMFTVPYVLGIGAALDSQGRVAAATNGYLLVPYAFGPAIYGLIGSEAIETLSYIPVLICAVSALLVGRMLKRLHGRAVTGCP